MRAYLWLTLHHATGCSVRSLLPQILAFALGRPGTTRLRALQQNTTTVFLPGAYRSKPVIRHYSASALAVVQYAD